MSIADKYVEKRKAENNNLGLSNLEVKEAIRIARLEASRDTLIQFAINSPTIQEVNETLEAVKNNLEHLKQQHGL